MLGDELTKALKKMEYYCTYSERCKSEVLLRMQQQGVPPQFYETILEYLQVNDFLNEARFAKEYTAGKFTLKKWGRQKIKSQLLSKGIDEKNIADALKEIRMKEYLAVLRTLVAQKMERTAFGELYACEKCINTMMQKGYEYELIVQTYLELKNECVLSTPK